MSRNISLPDGVRQHRGDGSDARDPQQFWKETFHGEKDEDKARNDEEEKAAPPQKIDGLGDEAFWTGNRVGGCSLSARTVATGKERLAVGVGDVRGHSGPPWAAPFFRPVVSPFYICDTSGVATDQICTGPRLRFTILMM